MTNARCPLTRAQCQIPGNVGYLGESYMETVDPLYGHHPGKALVERRWSQKLWRASTNCKVLAPVCMYSVLIDISVPLSPLLHQCLNICWQSECIRASPSVLEFTIICLVTKQVKATIKKSPRATTIAGAFEKSVWRAFPCPSY